MILHLTRDLGVNLAGVEIILNMREKMAEMQSQIEEFVATLNRELAARTGRPAGPKSGTADPGGQRPPAAMRAQVSWVTIAAACRMSLRTCAAIDSHRRLPSRTLRRFSHSSA